MAHLLSLEPLFFLLLVALPSPPALALIDPERLPPEASPPAKTFSLPPRSQAGFRNCQEIKQQGGLTPDGVYVIYPYDCCPQRPVSVYCDMTTEGGGWTVIQRRQHFLVKENFRRHFLEYALGFGHPSEDHWLGLDHIHALTDQKHNQIRIQLTNYFGNRTWAEYEFFYVMARERFFELQVKYYRGSAGDALTFHNGAEFKDIDVFSTFHESLGGWWHVRSRGCNLNGVFKYPWSHCYGGVFWMSNSGCVSLNGTVMMIRPNF